jgi:hypothetical protein
MRQHAAVQDRIRSDDQERRADRRQQRVDVWKHILPIQCDTGGDNGGEAERGGSIVERIGSGRRGAISVRQPAIKAPTNSYQARGIGE